ncbi:MAG: 50S ribosome-binding GTPase, partial [Clostridia bacterium]|nr:50S ribosome-binding GTPase [Clostridia bacterium]
QVEKQRSLRRKSREKNAIPLVALVGYTNAGKSTLLNKLSGASVYVKDQLFATLDAVSRNIALPDGGECLLVDTVGFIRKLPHTLISAFRSTLEEAALADVLVIVSDGASDEMMKQHQVVEEVLDQLGAVNQPRIEVVNKSDLGVAHREELPGALYVSAQKGDNLEALLTAIGRALHATRRPVTLMIPFSQYGLLSQVRPLGRVISETHEAEGTRLTILLTNEDIGRLTSRWGSGIFVAEN